MNDNWIRKKRKVKKKHPEVEKLFLRLREN
jgi:hypothetical protein